jgi:Chalcone isomerase-like
MFGLKCIRLVLLLVFASSVLVAKELPLPLKERTPPLTLRGTATLHWFGLHVYDVSLYTEDQPYTTNTTSVLSLEYAISIKHKRLQSTTLDEWKRLKIATPEQRDKWIAQLDGLWPDIKAGEQLSAYFQKDGSTTFYCGDRLLGEITDAAFGPAFFAIWLDEGCRYPKVRDGLLKKETLEKKGK